MSFSEAIFVAVCTPQHRTLQGQTIIQYPGGDRNSPVTVDRALVDLSALLGSNEITGDGAVTRDERGDRERDTGHIEVPKSLVVTEKDLWHIDGALYSTQRMNEKDASSSAGMHGWRVTAISPRRTQHSLMKENRPVQRG